MEDSKDVVNVCILKIQGYSFTGVFFASFGHNRLLSWPGDFSCNRRLCFLHRLHPWGSFHLGHGPRRHVRGLKVDKTKPIVLLDSIRNRLSEFYGNDGRVPHVGTLYRQNAIYRAIESGSDEGTPFKFRDLRIKNLEQEPSV